MSSHCVVSFGSVDTCLSSLKQCQSYISTGMEMATKVAFDLVENRNDIEDINAMEDVMLEYAAMNREVCHYVKAVQETVKQIKQKKPEILPDIKLEVEEKFKTLESTNTDLDLQRDEKLVHFKDQLRKMKNQFGVHSDPEEIPDLELVDEDIAVTESQVNFICPITQKEMMNPVRNKVCGHTYGEEAILQLLRNREQRKKKVCCPTIGCNNRNVRRSDLVPDEVLRRTIDSQSKQSPSTQ
ncbi:E3 SUMO-protein ligase NSE2 [Anolis carolinensis]|uniref:E3 SUMO-protein ligase NSE2 n=1 Tax=Anolis carolinensis TaxID=28377 RepID=G1KJZ2_ANOCA|nr:PREDICTED: E3 SUMO-protein ligase NSE2 [Anolis carolinensis]|eukprot:XP_003219443.1 PREDICTED: E3 SUMO-protein ligase NSE2 [Anolis carolinensis]